jgi:hypothetical protein
MLRGLPYYRKELTNFLHLPPRPDADDHVWNPCDLYGSSHFGFVPGV